MAFIPWFVNLIVGIAGWLTSYLGKRWAVRTAIIAGLVMLTAAFSAGLGSLVAGISVTTTNNSYFTFGLSLLPTNTVPCLSAYLSALVMRYIYDKQYSFYVRWMDSGGF